MPPKELCHFCRENKANSRSAYHHHMSLLTGSHGDDFYFRNTTVAVPRCKSCAKHDNPYPEMQIWPANIAGIAAAAVPVILFSILEIPLEGSFALALFLGVITWFGTMDYLDRRQMHTRNRLPKVIHDVGDVEDYEPVRQLIAQGWYDSIRCYTRICDHQNRRTAHSHPQEPRQTMCSPPGH